MAENNKIKDNTGMLEVFGARVHNFTEYKM